MPAGSEEQGSLTRGRQISHRSEMSAVRTAGPGECVTVSWSYASACLISETNSLRRETQSGGPFISQMLSLVVTYVLFYRPCYDRHALGHEAHPECSCKATFPFLPSTRKLLVGLDFVLVNLSSFDVNEMGDNSDESCNEGDLHYIFCHSVNNC